MNSNALFSMALGLSAPWQITDVDFKANDPARRELHLQIGFTLGTAYRLKALFNDLWTMPERQNDLLLPTVFHIDPHFPLATSTIFRSSTSKTRVAPGLIFGGDPRSP